MLDSLLLHRNSHSPFSTVVIFLIFCSEKLMPFFIVKQLNDNFVQFHQLIRNRLTFDQFWTFNRKNIHWHWHLWHSLTFMDIHGHFINFWTFNWPKHSLRLAFMDIHWHSWTFTDINRHSRTFMDIQGQS